MADELLDVIYANMLAVTSAVLHRVRLGRVSKKLRKRRFHVHPNNVNRREQSHFYTLFEPNYQDYHDRFFPTIE